MQIITLCVELVLDISNIYPFLFERVLRFKQTFRPYFSIITNHYFINLHIEYFMTYIHHTFLMQLASNGINSVACRPS